MSSLLSLVASHGLLQQGQGTLAAPDEAVRALQLALSQAGYRVSLDGVFGPGTQSAVERFQSQHGLRADGVVGRTTADLLDAPHEQLVASATPATKDVWPMDDTTSLTAFYGKPWEDSSLLVPITIPFQLTYDGKPFGNRIEFHRKAASQLAAVFAAIWDAYGHDQAALDATHITKFSGTYNYRPIRGSSRLSCHAFGAAIDLDAEDNPLGALRSTIPENIVACFDAQGFFWGGRYLGRKDNMHWQAAHE